MDPQAAASFRIMAALHQEFTGIQPGTTELPIKDYDSLSNNQIIKRLSGLSVEEIERLRDYEAKTKNRRLVIERLDERIRIIRQAGTTKDAKGSPEKTGES